MTRGYKGRVWVGKGLGIWVEELGFGEKVKDYCKRFRIWDWLVGFDMWITLGKGGILVGKDWGVGLWRKRWKSERIYNSKKC